MTNNDIFKKLRVALQLRDDQIMEILELVDFRISKGEIGNFFRNEDHEKYMECGDQVLRNFLNGLVIYLRGTKEAPKNPMEVLQVNAEQVKKNVKENTSKPKDQEGRRETERPANAANFSNKRPQKSKVKPKPIVEFVKYNNGKKK